MRIQDAVVELNQSSLIDKTIQQIDVSNVQINGRLGQRHEVNINYLLMLYKDFKRFMLDVYDIRDERQKELPWNLGYRMRLWDGEYSGKWLDAAALMASNTGDKELVDKVNLFAKELRSKQQSDGYMGIEEEDMKGKSTWEAWNIWYALYGFLTHYEQTQEQASLSSAESAGLWLIHNYGVVDETNQTFFEAAHAGGCNVDVIDQLIRLYEYTNKREFIDFVKAVTNYYGPIEEMRRSGNPKIMHPYVLCAFLGGVVNLAKIENNDKEIAWVESVWEKLVNRKLYPTGSLGYRERIESEPHDVPDENHQETCATVEWMLLTQRLYQATGKVSYIHILEDAIYNALLAAQSEDGTKWMYYTPLRYQKRWFSGGTYCCYWSGPRGIARIPEMVYSLDEQGLRIDLFEQSKAKLKVKGKEVTVEQTTEYPAAGKILLNIGLSQPLNFVMKLRTPLWSIVKTTINGKITKWNGEPGTYLDIERKWADKDQVEINFEMPTYLRPLGEYGEYGVVVARGPEVMSIDSRDNDELDLDSVRIPESISLIPTESKGNRRCYIANVLVNGKLTEVVFTPYADAGNDGARFRTVFPIGSVAMWGG